MFRIDKGYLFLGCLWVISFLFDISIITTDPSRNVFGIIPYPIMTIIDFLLMVMFFVFAFYKVKQ